MFAAHSRTLPSNPGSSTAQALGLPHANLPLFGACPDSAPLFLPPQLWDIRRKGCVFRYRVRRAPSGGHSTSTVQIWGVGGVWTGQGWSGQPSTMSENMRNESPSENRDSGAEQECCGWSTWTPAFHESPQSCVHQTAPFSGFTGR